MTHKYQSGRCRDWTISIPWNNKEAVFPPKLRKGVCHTAATESDKKIRSPSL